MVNNTVNATYVETYDLNTAIGEMSMLGIHTPQAPALKQMYKGFFENYKKFKIVSCDIAMVCASTQNLTPDLVGMEAGSVDPRDVLNPILFRACTGDTINVLVDQIYDSGSADSANGSIEAHRVNTNSSTAILGAYYNFLADDSWKKSHPQSGLVVRDLKPFVHRVVTTQPFKWNGASGSAINAGVVSRPAIGGNVNLGTNQTVNGFGGVNGSSGGNPTVFVSNGLADMPWMDTTFEGPKTFLQPDSGTGGYVPKSNPEVALNLINDIPKVWMGAIILPPAILQRLFFRMQIRWHVMFKDFRPAFEVGPIGSYATYEVNTAGFGSAVTPGSGSTPTYFNMYHSTTTLKQSMSSFDCTGDTEISEVNQKAM